ncbi:acyl-CoA carboxylase epsilon subunit [Streptomyces sp. enrichment culture]|uniref:acyl-CoA carboxylase epsilon subunit n=1 Tax=Streptomyces sp. enrichment culture TaxID=1795815 RepID=UPI003F5634FA
MSTAVADVLRVERGHAAREEIAAVLALLLALAGADGPPERAHPPAVRWQRPERRAGYGSPRSWRH